MTSSGILYLIPSPIDISATEVIPEQTKTILKNLDYFLVENLRSARRFVSSLKLGINIENLEFELYDKRTSFEETLNLLSPLYAGKNGGVISEAGCPGIADPGSLAVKAAHQMNIKVVPLVGPSSLFLALMASGFSGQSFAFHGYLPIDKQDRNKRIKQLESLVIKNGQSQIFMETPYRNEALFNSLLDVCHPNTNLCIASGINSPNEMIRSLSIDAWRKTPIQLHKIPTIFIFGN